MKLEKVFVKNFIEILKESELKNHVGGYDSNSNTGCTGNTKATCNSGDECKDSDGNIGKCGWTGAHINKCTCAVVTLGYY